MKQIFLHNIVTFDQPLSRKAAEIIIDVPEVVIWIVLLLGVLTLFI